MGVDRRVVAGVFEEAAPASARSCLPRAIIASVDFLGTGTNVEYDRARAVVLPVPLEASVSYGRGTALGPRAILAASAQVETWDEGLQCEPRDCGIWTAPELELPHSLEQAVETIRRRIGQLMDEGKWVVMLGGEHSVTPGAVAAAAQRHPGLQVVQLDAHADLREEYEGERFSHACAMARCLSHAAVTAIGIRSYGPEEARRIRAGIPGYRLLHASELADASRVSRAIEDLAGAPVYLTVDVDFFDPALVPSTGTPEPGGCQWWPTVGLLERLFARVEVVGADVVELAPIEGLHHPDFTIARLVHRLIGLRFRGG